MNMKAHADMHHPAGLSRLRRARAGEHGLCAKAYRRKGYRVIIDRAPREKLRWSVYRPRMHTAVASGLVASLEAAIEDANAWIATDPALSRIV
jgi:hypothetical protein